ncbi:unnamed protein product [Staurois parvus]|uniref:Uncharacterized protein n=1 Tax=Staurois parvus TaxID=386267 RepID=A0ABN9EAR7_9NEOB|nr:unnamed protein product [Staurois parvus]
MERPVRYFHRGRVRIPGRPLSSAVGHSVPLSSGTLSSASVVWALGMTAGCQVRMRKKRCFL